MGNDDRKADRRGGASRARLILPVAAAGVFIASIAVLLHGSRESHTVSHVQRTVREIALAGGSPDAPPGAGAIGPWKIGASGVDPLTGEFADFHLEAGSIVLGAEKAALFVDAKADTFGFEMWNVVFSRVPEPGGDEPGAFMHWMDHYILGPAPYGRNIVPDAKCSVPIDRPQPPAPSEQTVADADGSAPAGAP